MNKGIDTAVIVLNWQGWQHTLRCVESLNELLSQSSMRLLVCDNGSQDESWEKLDNELVKQGFSYNNSENTPAQIQLLQTGANLGFAGGMNYAIRHALKDPKIDYVWLLNNDTWLDEDALSPLKQAAQDRPDVGLWGSAMYDAQGQLQSLSGYHYNPWLTRIKALKTPAQPSYVDGAALFIPRVALDKIGLLTEAYFLFYEELDYSERLKQVGLKVATCPKSRVYHQGSASLGGESLKKRTQRQYYENHSTLLFSAKFYPWRLWFILPWRLSVKLLLLALRREWDLYPALWQAYKDFFTK